MSVALVVLVMALGPSLPTSFAGHVSSLPAPAAVGHSASAAPAPSVASSAGKAAAPTHLATPATHPLSSASNFSAPYFYNTTSGFADPPASNVSCAVYSYPPYYYDSDCYYYEQQPTLLRLANDNVGVGFSTVANTSLETCPTTTPYYTITMGSMVGFAISTDNGSTFGTPVWIGGGVCAYPSSLEPTFALGTGGVIYGAYVAANYSYNPTYYNGNPDRSGDALAFVTSTDNGSSFSSPTYLNTGGNISYPVMAAFGDTVYIVYENVSNGTTIIPTSSYYTSYPPNLQFIVSTDGGSTWSAPQILPGQNATASYLAMSPSIAVSSDGEVAVAYATNYTCVEYCSSLYGQFYALDIVTITSTTNGSTWVGPTLVASQAGSSPRDFSWYDIDWLWQYTPVTQVAFSPDGSTLYVAWSAAYNTTGGTTGWGNPGIFAAVSTDGGITWTRSTVAAQYYVPSYSQDSWSHPGLAVASDGTVYLTYLWANQTYGYNCGSVPDFLDGLEYQVVSTSTDGIHWTGPDFIGVQSNLYTTYTDGWGGWTSSVAFSEAGMPLIAYSQPQVYQFTYNYVNGTSYDNYTYHADLEVASVYSGPTVTIEFNASSGLPANQPWTVLVNMVPFTTTESSMNISGIPLGVNVYLNVAPYDRAVSGTRQYGPTNFYTYMEWNAYYSFTEFNITFAEFWPFYLYFEPSVVQDMYVDVYFGSTCGEIDSYGQAATYYGALPWWVENNSYLYISPYVNSGTPPVVYWNGSGNNSYTGPGSYADVEVSGSPLTETFWMAYSTDVNQTIVPVGLPSTSVYSFEFDGSTYSAVGNSSITLYSIVVGPHSITDIQANSSLSGYAYYGYASTGPTVDAPMDGIVYLHFALVDTTSTPGTVSFQENGLDAGTTWYLSFNGTTLSTSSSWQNVTAPAGTYDVAATAAVAPSALTSWVSTGFGPTASVTPGSSYTVNFAPTYRFSASASVGGSIAGPSTLWVLPGTLVNVNATPATGYRFVGWTGTGTGSYTGSVENITVAVGSPVWEGAAFVPLPNARFNLTFNETGLPSGQSWSVVVGGTGYSSSTSQIVVPGLLATTGTCSSTTPTRYSLTVPYTYVASAFGIRYVPGTYPSGACTNGFTVINLAFTVQYEVTLQATVGGIAAGYSSRTPGASTALWVDPTDAVTISAYVLPGYTFVGWQGTGSGSYSGTVSMDTLGAAGPVNELAVFALVVVPPTPTFMASFHEQTTLAGGTAWSVTIGSKAYASTSSFLNVSGLVNGTYTLSVATVVSPDGLTQYAPTGAPAVVKIQGANVSIPFSYATSFWVWVTSNIGGSIRPASGWVQLGGTVTINATAQDDYAFSGWVGTGAGAYTGSDPQVKITVNNSITEVAHFAPVATSVGSSSGGNGFWSSSASWIAFGLIGLVVGLLVGLLLLRSRTPPAAPAPSAEETPPYAEAGETPAEDRPSGGTP